MFVSNRLFRSKNPSKNNSSFCYITDFWAINSCSSNTEQSNIPIIQSRNVDEGGGAFRKDAAKQFAAL